MVEWREIVTCKKGLQKSNLEWMKKEDLFQKIALRRGEHSRHNEQQMQSPSAGESLV